MRPESDLDDCLLPEMFSEHLLKYVELLPEDRRQSCGVAFYKDDKYIDVFELFNSFLDFSGVEAGFIVGVLEAGSVDDGDAVISWVS